MTVPNVLGAIAKDVAKRLEFRKQALSYEKLKEGLTKARMPHDFEGAFRKSGVHIISEVKFRSPALGLLSASDSMLALETAKAYARAGATAISVLTEMDHFQGSPEYLKQIRAACPEALLLMKDFILEEYQILEGKLWGADAILLIVAMLGRERTTELLTFARSQGLSVLVETHDEQELTDAIEMGASLIGVNNRNLKTLEVKLQTSFDLAPKLKAGNIYISESGITSSAEIKSLRSVGYQGFLIGSSLMTSGDPEQKLKQWIEEAQ